jgi:hypothetical protein
MMKNKLLPDRQFNPRDFNLKTIIKKRADLEAEVEHANDPIPPLPKFVAKKDKKNLLWWWNFSKNLVKELEP